MKELNTELEDILVKRHIVVANDEYLPIEDLKSYNALLFANFGIILDKPRYVNKQIIEALKRTYRLSVPKSFYANPQDLSYYSCNELLVEQLVSYFVIEITGADNESTNFDHIEVFKKDLPQYFEGDELKKRMLYVLSLEDATKKLEEITASYSSYTRPFGADELDEYIALVTNGYYKGENIACKDNIMSVLDIVPEASKMLDFKDLVKLSSKLLNNDIYSLDKQFRMLTTSEKDKLKLVYENAHYCPLSKKQAKYYNKISKLLGHKTDYDNSASPYKAFMKEIREGNILKAAQICAQNGSLLERNLRILLARANETETKEILNMLSDKNPIVLFQFYNTLEKIEGPRTFIFSKDYLLKRHTETEYETKWRKSALSDKKINLIKSTLQCKIKSYYSALPSLGKIYISPEFEKIALPTNTNTSGKGIDVLPTGSRLKITKDYLRTFVYWNEIYDIDSSLALKDKGGNLVELGFWNYSDKLFGNSCLSSGDCRGNNGAEYYDIKLSELKEKGFTQILQVFNGYQSNLNVGTIKAGFQYKDNLNTRAWSAKNIEMEMNIKGDSRECVSFGIDLNTNEIIVINQMLNCDSRVLDDNTWKGFEKYFDSKYLEINMKTILECCGEVVNTPEEADIVFDRDYVALENQQTVRPYEIEKLVEIINRKSEPK